MLGNMAVLKANLNVRAWHYKNQRILNFSIQNKHCAKIPYGLAI